MDIKTYNPKYKVYLYGAGLEYNKLTSYLSAYRYMFEVMGIVVSKPIEMKCIDGYQIIPIYEISDSEYDFIILASRRYWKEMLAECIAGGVEEEKVIRGSIFELPRFDFEEYIRLEKSKVSILSNYCAGGLIYKELGLKMLSPTINMICEGENFFRFLADYEYYLGKGMRLYDDGYGDADSYRLKNDYIRFMPRGIIDDKVVWYFAHETDPKKEVALWNIRRKRVNIDNIAIIMIIQSDEEAHRFASLPFSKKIGLYYKDMNLPSVIKIDGWEDAAERRAAIYRWHVYANNCVLNTKGKISKIDWIRFLNGSEDFIRY